MYGAPLICSYLSLNPPRLCTSFGTSRVSWVFRIVPPTPLFFLPLRLSPLEIFWVRLCRLPRWFGFRISDLLQM